MLKLTPPMGWNTWNTFGDKIDEKLVRETADFIEVTAWRKAGEFVHKYFAKGQQIIVVGELQSNSYTDKNGVKRKDIRVRASEIHFAGSAKHTSDAPAFEEAEDEDNGNLPF